MNKKEINMNKYKITIKLSIIRQYELHAEDEWKAIERALVVSSKDMSDCDKYEILAVDIYGNDGWDKLMKFGKY